MTRWKRLTAYAAVLVLLAVMMPPAHAAAGDFAVVSNTSYLNIRSGPGTGFERVGRVNRGGWVEILARLNNDWYQCRAVDSGLVGYMSAAYLRSAAGSGGGMATVQNPGASQFLNLRQYPSYNAPVLAIFYNGTPVNVISQADGWCYVLVGGLNGYFRAEFLSFAGGGGGNAGPATIYSSNGGRVNMRTGPSYAYNAAWQLSHGTTVTVLLKGTRFWQISHGGNVGFVDSNFLRSGTSPAPSPGGTGNAVVRKGANLNLREQPNLNARVLGQYIAGTQVQVRQQGTQWCLVTVPATGARGYMMTRYLTLKNLPQVPTLMVRHPQSTYVNLRSQPRQTATRIITRVPHNSIVTVITPGTDWVYVQYKSMKGYMMASFLKSY